MAGPLRFRYSPDAWDRREVRDRLFGPLDGSLGAEMTTPWYAPPDGHDAVRFEMADGSFALFCWRTGAAARQGDLPAGQEPSGGEAFWLGNTETPEALWRTEKFSFAEVPYPVTRWAERELLAMLAEEDPWLADYEYVAWFFLPVFHSKDGRETTRRFFGDHAAGFPDADREAGLAFFEDVLRTGTLDDYRYTMAAKLGTGGMDIHRMAATMSEFTVAKLLHDAGLSFEPEVMLDSGHALDFRAGGRLVEVTRPMPPPMRDGTDSPVVAVREAGAAKGSDQLAAHPDAVLVVDCSSFAADAWRAVAGERPGLGHQPALVVRARPDGSVEGFHHGGLPWDLDGAVEWVT